jgi:hypothetical protein
MVLLNCWVLILEKWVVRSPREAYTLLKRGDNIRATGTTKLNELSSRSHVVFIIIVEQSTIENVNDVEEQIFKIGKLNLVDLAGSERVRITGATGTHLEESKKINQV